MNIKKIQSIIFIWGLTAILIVILGGGNWNQLAAIATWFLVLGIVFAILQIQETKRSTNAQVAVSLFEKLRDGNILNTFREIYGLKPNDIRRLLTSTKEEDVKLRHRIEGVLDKFELLGALVAQGVIDERIAIEAYGGPPVPKCWYQLGGNYIKKVRRQRGLFCKYVEDFAARTFDYQKKLSPEDEWVWFRRSEKGKLINLIEKFRDNPELRPRRQK